MSEKNVVVLDLATYNDMLMKISQMENCVRLGKGYDGEPRVEFSIPRCAREEFEKQLAAEHPEYSLQLVEWESIYNSIKVTPTVSKEEEEDDK